MPDPNPLVKAATDALAEKFGGTGLFVVFPDTDGHQSYRSARPGEAAVVAVPAALRAAAEQWDALAARIGAAPAVNLGQEWDRHRQVDHAVDVAEWLRNRAGEIEREAGR